MRFVVVDSEPKGMMAFGLAQKLAEALGAAYYKIEDLAADDLAAVARKTQYA
jgi:Mg-chelatase subunit ChlD